MNSSSLAPLTGQSWSTRRLAAPPWHGSPAAGHRAAALPRWAGDCWQPHTCHQTRVQAPSTSTTGTVLLCFVTSPCQNPLPLSLRHPTEHFSSAVESQAAFYLSQVLPVMSSDQSLFTQVQFPVSIWATMGHSLFQVAKMEQLLFSLASRSLFRVPLRRMWKTWSCTSGRHILIPSLLWSPWRVLWFLAH